MPPPCLRAGGIISGAHTGCQRLSKSVPMPMARPPAADSRVYGPMAYTSVPDGLAGSGEDERRSLQRRARHTRKAMRPMAETVRGRPAPRPTPRPMARVLELSFEGWAVGVGVGVWEEADGMLVVDACPELVRPGEFGAWAPTSSSEVDTVLVVAVDTELVITVVTLLAVTALLVVLVVVVVSGGGRQETKLGVSIL